MIDANELRIGNWVYGGIRNIQIHRGHFANSDFGIFNPIPLTPEILEMCGFKYRKEGSSVLLLPIAYTEPGDMECTLQRWVGTDHISICRNGQSAIAPTVQYLHQLQNLIYCLTGTELSISL